MAAVSTGGGVARVPAARPGGRKRQHKRKLSGDFEKGTQELHSATEPKRTNA